jgi:hypothetical protein
MSPKTILIKFRWQPSTHSEDLICLGAGGIPRAQRMTAYLGIMANRLLELHRVPKPARFALSPLRPDRIPL